MDNNQKGLECINIDYVNITLKAINKTIEIHEYAIENNIDYIDARIEINSGKCPLCKMSEECRTQIGINSKCKLCPWYIFTGDICSLNEEIDYCNNEESVERLESWKKEIKKNKEEYKNKLIKAIKGEKNGKSGYDN